MAEAGMAGVTLTAGAEAAADSSRISPSSTGDEDGRTATTAAVAEEEEEGLDMTEQSITAVCNSIARDVKDGGAKKNKVVMMQN